MPFLDHHLVEYALALPIDLKIKGASGKYILKRALETVLPGGICCTGASVALARPFASGFAARSGETLAGLIMNSSIRGRGVV